MIQELRKNLKTGVFIDGANLYYSQKQNGWKINLQFEKIRQYIEYQKITPRSYPGRILLPLLYNKINLKSNKK